MPGFVIKQVAGTAEMWLRRVIPTVTWGPRADARVFSTRGEAASTARRLMPEGRLVIEGAEDG